MDRLAYWKLQPLQLGWLKLNSDVAICPFGSYIEFSVRYSHSSLCMAYMKRLGAMNLLVGEALALVEAMMLAKRHRWPRVVFESN